MRCTCNIFVADATTTQPPLQFAAKYTLLINSTIYTLKLEYFVVVCWFSVFAANGFEMHKFVCWAMDTLCNFFGDSVGASSKQIVVLLCELCGRRTDFVAFTYMYVDLGCTIHCIHVCVSICICVDLLFGLKRFVPFDLELVRFLWSSELKLFKVCRPETGKNLIGSLHPECVLNVFLWFYSQINFPNGK